MSTLTSSTLQRGRPYPFGATVTPEGVNFALASKHATAVTLCLFGTDGQEPLGSFELDPRLHRTGDVWHVCVPDLTLPVTYAYQVNGPGGKRYRFDKNVLLVDPYAKAFLSTQPWGSKEPHSRGVVLAPQPFDWEGDQPLGLPVSELIIYEMHVRGFTQHSSSGVTHPGTYRGMIEKIPYLVELGITAVELLPIYIFDECKSYFKDPKTGQPLIDTWGYSPLSFFAPMPHYASTTALEAAVLECKELIKALHKAGIEVILDVVYNHTGEGGYPDTPISLKGIDYPCYYHLDAADHPLDFSGCGNSINANHIFTKELILSSLRYWVTEMHVDGFRFDLASVLNRGRYGRPLATSPLVDSLSQDPILAATKLIAEPWDAAGMYQVGAFYWQENRWCEWNGKYRDSVRRFLNGIDRSKGEFAMRLSGSQDLYGHCRRPCSSINFIIAHDGFCLADLVAYNQKHNEANGEENRDGTNDNYSWNCGNKRRK